MNDLLTIVKGFFWDAAVPFTVLFAAGYAFLVFTSKKGERWSFLKGGVLDLFYCVVGTACIWALIFGVYILPLKLLGRI